MDLRETKEGEVRQVYFVSLADNAPLARVRRTDPQGGEISLLVDLFAVVALVAGLTFLAAYPLAWLINGVLERMMARPNPDADLMIAVGVAAVAGLATAWDRLRAIDRLRAAPFVEESEYQKIETVGIPPDVDVSARQIPLESPAGRTLISFRQDVRLSSSAGEHTFTGRQLDALARLYGTGEVALRREDSSAGPGIGQVDPGFASGPAYNLIRQLLMSHDYVEASGRWTPAGLLWLERAGLPSR